MSPSLRRSLFTLVRTGLEPSELSWSQILFSSCSCAAAVLDSIYCHKSGSGRFISTKPRYPYQIISNT